MTVGKCYFSPRENEIIKIVRNRKLTVKQISAELFPDQSKKPFDDCVGINNSIRRINEKCAFYKLEWSLVRNKLTISKVNL
jgi:hypothetical protein